jgi:hypothetical protein
MADRPYKSAVSSDHRPTHLKGSEIYDRDHLTEKNQWVRFSDEESYARAKKSQLKKAWVDFIGQVIGTPHYSFTLTLKPVSSSTSCASKTRDAQLALSWFLNVLNTRCFGHGYHRKGIELGFYAALEGLGEWQQPHWHGAIRLPKCLSHEKFLSAFEIARLKTRRFGRKFDLTPFYEHSWFIYTIKNGADSAQPQFLRRGTP